jgi:hypothetical protein
MLETEGTNRTGWTFYSDLSVWKEAKKAQSRDRRNVEWRNQAITL